MGTSTIVVGTGRIHAVVGVYRKVIIMVEGVPNGKTYKANAYPKRVADEYYEVPVYNLTVSGKNDAGKDESKTWEVLRFMPYHSPPKNILMSGLTDPQTKYIPAYIRSYKVHNTATIETGAFQIQGNFLIHDGPDDIQLNIGWGAAGCIEVCGRGGFDTLKYYIAELSGYKGTDIEDCLESLASKNKIFLELKKASRPPIKKLF